MAIKFESLSDEQLLKLREALNYRSFLSIYLEIFEYRLADFARATGFGRGFPGEIISGKRRLTSKSGHAFEKALKLPLPAKKLFRALVAIEEKDFSPEIDRKNLNQEISRLREKPWRKIRTNSSEDVFTMKSKTKIDKKALILYAAAGDFKNGATFKELQERTGFSEEVISKLTSDLEAQNLIEIKDSVRIIPKDLHLFLKTCDQSKLLTHSFLQSAELAMDRVGLKKRDNEFFFSSSFCINESKLPELKEELREIILKYIDNSIEPSGDKIANLILALHL